MLERLRLWLGGKILPSTHCAVRGRKVSPYLAEDYDGETLMAGIVTSPVRRGDLVMLTDLAELAEAPND